MVWRKKKVKCELYVIAAIYVDSTKNLECYQALGMENGAISDQQISASSRLNWNHYPHYGRLNSQRSWAAGYNNAYEWIQVDLGNQYTTVTGVATQGRSDYNQWVTKYKLQ